MSDRAFSDHSAYDEWRYNYPKYDTTQNWAKVPSQQFSDASLFGKYKDREKRIEWYQKECDCSKCRTAAYRKKMAETHFEVVMPYWYYKQNYPDCKTLRDSFNREMNEILVFVPKKNVKKGE